MRAARLEKPGRVLLASAPEEWREAYLKTERFKALTTATPTDRVQMRELMVTIRQRGYDIGLGHTVDDVGSVAAPVMKPDGTADVAFLVAGPLARIERNLPQLIATIRTVAEKASGIVST